MQTGCRRTGLVKAKAVMWGTAVVAVLALVPAARVQEPPGPSQARSNAAAPAPAIASASASSGPANAALQSGAALIVAAASGDMESLRQLLARGVDVNAAGPDGASALMYAVVGGHDEAAAALLAGGANARALTSNGQDALWFAADAKKPAMVALLLRHGSDVKHADNFGATALLRAAKQGDLESARLLVEAGAEVNAPERAGQTPLRFAAQGGFAALVRYLLSQGASPDAADQNGDTPLMGAIFSGSLESVAALMQAGADVNHVSNGGAGPLALALAKGDYEIVKLLLAGGAKRDDLTALLIAARNGRAGALRALLEAGAEANAARSDGTTPLLVAAETGDADSVRILLEHGARRDAALPNGATPLFVAEWNHHDQVVRLLLGDDYAAHIEKRDALISAAKQGNASRIRQLIADGAPVNSPGPDLGPALSWAADGGHIAAVQALLDSGKTIPAVRDLALGPAVWQGRGEIVRMLLAAGASPRYVANEGPLVEVARNRGHTELAELLLQQGAQEPQYEYEYDIMESVGGMPMGELAGCTEFFYKDVCVGGGARAPDTGGAIYMGLLGRPGYPFGATLYDRNPEEIEIPGLPPEENRLRITRAFRYSADRRVEPVAEVFVWPGSVTRKVFFARRGAHISAWGVEAEGRKIVLPMTLPPALQGNFVLQWW